MGMSPDELRRMHAQHQGKQREAVQMVSFDELEVWCELTHYFMQYFAELGDEALLLPCKANPDATPEAVVVLSGAPLKLPDGSLDEKSFENVARVEWGAEIALKGRRLPLYLCGATEQLESMLEIGRESLGGMVNPNFATEVLQLEALDAGPRETANTPSQFQAIAGLGFGYVVVVTSGYHGPRTLLTALIQAPEVVVGVAGVPYAYDWHYDAATKASDEIGKIITYAAKGDIADPGELPPFGPFDSLP